MWNSLSRLHLHCPVRKCLEPALEFHLDLEVSNQIVDIFLNLLADLELFLLQPSQGDEALVCFGAVEKSAVVQTILRKEIL